MRDSYVPDPSLMKSNGVMKMCDNGQPQMRATGSPRLGCYTVSPLQQRVAFTIAEFSMIGEGDESEKHHMLVLTDGVLADVGWVRKTSSCKCGTRLAGKRRKTQARKKT